MSCSRQQYISRDIFTSLFSFMLYTDCQSTALIF